MGRRHRESRRPWHGRARHALRHSIKLRMVIVFLLLALATTVVFVGGVQKALSVGWQSGARPLVADYVDRLAAEIGSPPSIERARAIADRLPVSVRISGPALQWQSDAALPSWRREGREPYFSGGAEPGERREVEQLLTRTTADGHRIEFGLNPAAWQNQPRRLAWGTLGALLLFTALAWLYVRRLLRPLDDIRDGARRFGTGDFAEPIPVRHRNELGVLAQDVNAMAHEIHGMLDAKRALLLAISHELRSPITRARLNTELLPETPEVQAPREALLRDLALMRDLVADLLESERLAGRHAALQREPTDLAALAREVVEGFGTASPGIVLHADAGLPELPLDRSRVRLLLRNLLDNALRHGAGAGTPVALTLAAAGDGGIALAVRDHGPGVDEVQLSQLAQPFWRADSARGRSTGGVGLGLYLCRLVAQAHGAQWTVRNAQPGLEVRVDWPAA